jgi:uncharacterized RDD family membrane protein YckC
MTAQRASFASAAERIFANLLDGFALLIVSGLLGLILKAPALALLVSFAVSVLYYVYFTASSWQASPAQRLLGILVVRTDGRMLRERDALERFLAFILPSLPIYANILSDSMKTLLFMGLTAYWFIPILWTPERTGFHDRLCQTRVIRGRTA